MYHTIHIINENKILFLEPIVADTSRITDRIKTDDDKPIQFDEKEKDDLKEEKLMSSKEKQEPSVLKKKQKDKDEITDQSPTSQDQSKESAEMGKKNGKKSDSTDKDKKQNKQQTKTEDLSDSSIFSDEERTHRSFRVLNDKELDEIDDSRKKKRHKKDDEIRSRSLETRSKDKLKRSKIPTPLFKSSLSKSDRHLNQSYKETNLDVRIPSLPNIRDEKHLRCDSNMSAPLLTSILSDKERDSISDGEDESRNKSKRFIKRRSKNRDSRSAGSDYESSNLIDSGFEPSPRSTRVPKWRNVSERGVNMTSVTQSIQTNIRRYVFKFNFY